MSIKSEYSNFLELNFKGLELKSPLFFNWNLSLRFDLQKEFTNPVEFDDNSYFNEVYRRAGDLFEFCFDDDDDIYISNYLYKWRKQRFRKSNIIFKLIEEVSDNNTQFNRVTNRYERGEKWNQLLVKEKVKNIDTKNLVVGMCNSDFPMMKPSIEQEVYIINIKKKLIFYIYDDRGLDIVASNNEFLIELYNRFDEWILECNRDKIKQQLKIQ